MTLVWRHNHVIDPQVKDVGRLLQEKKKKYRRESNGKIIRILKAMVSEWPHYYGDLMIVKKAANPHVRIVYISWRKEWGI
jgi:hypothetical protein